MAISGARSSPFFRKSPPPSAGVNSGAPKPQQAVASSQNLLAPGNLGSGANITNAVDASQLEIEDLISQLPPDIQSLYQGALDSTMDAGNRQSVLSGLSELEDDVNGALTTVSQSNDPNSISPDQLSVPDVSTSSASGAASSGVVGSRLNFRA